MCNASQFCLDFGNKFLANLVTFFFVTYGWQFAIVIFYMFVVVMNMVAASAAANQIKRILFKTTKMKQWKHTAHVLTASLRVKCPYFFFIKYKTKQPTNQGTVFVCSALLCVRSPSQYTTLVRALSNDTCIYIHIHAYSHYYTVYTNVCADIVCYRFIYYYTVETGDTVERSYWCVLCRKTECTQNGLIRSILKCSGSYSKPTLIQPHDYITSKTIAIRVFAHTRF